MGTQAAGCEGTSRRPRLWPNTPRACWDPRRRSAGSSNTSRRPRGRTPFLRSRSSGLCPHPPRPLVVYIVTSPFHQRRSLLVFRQAHRELSSGAAFEMSFEAAWWKDQEEAAHSPPLGAARAGRYGLLRGHTRLARALTACNIDRSPPRLQSSVRQEDGQDHGELRHRRAALDEVFVHLGPPVPEVRPQIRNHVVREGPHDGQADDTPLVEAEGSHGLREAKGLRCSAHPEVERPGPEAPRI